MSHKPQINPDLTLRHKKNPNRIHPESKVMNWDLPYGWIFSKRNKYDSSLASIFCELFLNILNPFRMTVG